MPWEANGQIAKISCECTRSQRRWSCEFDCSQPHLGLSVHPEVAGASRCDWHLLRVRPVPAHSCAVDDWFTRGSDLMVRYAQRDSERFAFQIDLRPVVSDQLGACECGWDVWVSVQTQLLDAHPALEVTHALPAGEWSVLPGHMLSGAQSRLGGLVCKAPSGTFAMLVHPSDQAQAERLTPADRTADSVTTALAASGVRLLGDFMEKGVIRRVRLRCLWSAEHLTAEQMADAMAQFAECPLPLTA